ncbi:transposase [Streptomyces sp. TE33382]
MPLASRSWAAQVMVRWPADVRTGIPWRYLPHDYPHRNTVCTYSARWQEEGVFDQLNSLLGRQVHRQEGRGDEPTACVIDSQSIKTSTNVPAAGQGIKAGKKIVGHKRSIVIDTAGIALGVLVTAASVQDSTAGRTLIERIADEHPTIRETWVDGGYRQHLVEHAAALGIDMHIVRRDPTTRGFSVLPRRWTVERTLGWPMNHRRPARDHEAKPHQAEAMSGVGGEVAGPLAGTRGHLPSHHRHLTCRCCAWTSPYPVSSLV